MKALDQVAKNNVPAVAWLHLTEQPDIQAEACVQLGLMMAAIQYINKRQSKNGCMG